MENNGLGRIESKSLDHLKLFNVASLGRQTVQVVEKTLVLPSWHSQHDQGAEGACVGFGTSMMLAILNLHQCSLQGAKNPYIRYNPWWLWDRAKETDEFAETNPGDENGTTVRAACEILRTQGHVVWDNEDDPKSFCPPQLSSGISAYRWATTVDDVRTAIDSNNPLSIGVTWYSSFDVPEYTDGEWWIGKDATNIGMMRGGHCVCIYGASDQRQAVRIKNSWGAKYPEVWMRYETLDRLIRENGEVSLITDI